MFQFKQFTIHQDRTPMKVGTDGVLLGAWAPVEQAQRILDIGTGTGLLALMAAQRNPSAHIDALEIEDNAYQQASENIKLSPWSERISIFHCALQTYSSTHKYDCILCNPPFFNQSTKAPNQGRTLARHNDSLPLSDLITYAQNLLTPGGVLCVILPIIEAQEFITLGAPHHLYPHHITQVCPTPAKPPKRTLIQMAFQATEPLKDELVIELERHRYTPAYTHLTKAFYLKL